MSGSTINVVGAKWIAAAVRDGISLLIKVRLSFVADRLIFASLQLPGTQCKHFAVCIGYGNFNTMAPLLDGQRNDMLIRNLSRERSTMWPGLEEALRAVLWRKRSELQCCWRL
jgi:hypothetical protein